MRLAPDRDDGELHIEGDIRGDEAPLLPGARRTADARSSERVAPSASTKRALPEDGEETHPLGDVEAEPPEVEHVAADRSLGARFSSVGSSPCSASQYASVGPAMPAPQIRIVFAPRAFRLVCFGSTLLECLVHQRCARLGIGDARYCTRRQEKSGQGDSIWVRGDAGVLGRPLGVGPGTASPLQTNAAPSGRDWAAKAGPPHHWTFRTTPCWRSCLGDASAPQHGDRGRHASWPGRAGPSPSGPWRRSASPLGPDRSRSSDRPAPSRDCRVRGLSNAP